MASSPVSFNSEYLSMFDRATLVRERAEKVDGEYRVESIEVLRQNSIVEASVHQHKLMRSIP